MLFSAKRYADGKIWWAWGLRSSNGKPLCFAPKLYTSKRNAIDGANDAMQMLTSRNFLVVDETK
jgi:uncharacterized protein YegP (UPF0339 family)